MPPPDGDRRDRGVAARCAPQRVRRLTGRRWEATARRSRQEDCYGIKVLTAAAAGLSGLLVLGLVIVAGATSPDATSPGGSGGASSLGDGPAGVCVAVGPVGGLSDAQAFNAEAVVAASDAVSGGSAVAAAIALMTAYTESGLIDLGPRPGNDGSLGLFQQRSSQGWGTAAQEEDPTAATVMFVTRPLGVPGWSTMAPWAAAQAVQHSAFTDGSNYAANWALGGDILDGVDLLAGGADCGELAGAVPAGPAGRDGLPVGYSIPAAADPAERAVLAYALAQLGRPYVWGAAGPVVVRLLRADHGGLGDRGGGAAALRRRPTPRRHRRCQPDGDRLPVTWCWSPAPMGPWPAPAMSASTSATGWSNRPSTPPRG